MKLGFTTLACPEWDLRQIIAAATENGYDGIDFRGFGEHLDICQAPEFGPHLGETLRMIRDAGLEVPCLSSSARMYAGDEVPAQLDEVRRYSDLAARMGARFIRVFGGHLNGADWAHGKDAAVDTLRQMAEIAAPAGVTIAVETHDDWVASAPLAEVIRRVDRRDVRILWDVHHPLILAGESIEETYANLGALTAYTHFKDSAKTPEGKRVPVLPGRGDVPIDEIVAILADGGYDGYLTLEWEKRWIPEADAPEIALPAWADALRAAIAKAGR